MSDTIPSMSAWEAAWLSADREQLKRCYAPDGVVIPPSQPLLDGPEAIVGYLQGGMGQVEVRFFPTVQRRSDTQAWERGIVKDFQPGTDTIVETCDYLVSWTLIDGEWKIQSHTWTIAL